MATRPALLEGAVKGIGGAGSLDVGGQEVSRSTVMVEARDHNQAMRVLGNSLGSIEAVGHRVVHGGDRYVESTLITEEVESGIDALSELAPLHNPACLAGIRGAKAVMGATVPMVAVFDTAFHRTMPEVASILSPQALRALQRLFGRRDCRREIDRDLDGVYAVGRLGHGDALWRYRSFHRQLSLRAGKSRTGRSGAMAQSAVWPAGTLRTIQ